MFRCMGIMAMRCPAVVVPAISSSIALLAACGNSDRKSVSLDSALGSRAEEVEGLAVCTDRHAWRTATWLRSSNTNLNYPGDLSSPEALVLVQISKFLSNGHDLKGYCNNLTPGYVGNTSCPEIGCGDCHCPRSIHACQDCTILISFLANTSGTAFSLISVSGKFVLCTLCHLLHDSSGMATAETPHTLGQRIAYRPQYANMSTYFTTAITGTFLEIN